ncbi:MAG: hypothetical protein FJW30_17860 [Acidobacteria bacterium]|nr:hypothetical protein [Acidobacteriota bacterium]
MSQDPENSRRWDESHDAREIAPGSGFSGEPEPAKAAPGSPEQSAATLKALVQRLSRIADRIDGSQPGGERLADANRERPVDDIDLASVETLIAALRSSSAPSTAVATEPAVLETCVARPEPVSAPEPARPVLPAPDFGYAGWQPPQNPSPVFGSTGTGEEDLDLLLDDIAGAAQSEPVFISEPVFSLMESLSGASIDEEAPVAEVSVAPAPPDVEQVYIDFPLESADTNADPGGLFELISAAGDLKPPAGEIVSGGEDLLAALDFEPSSAEPIVAAGTPVFEPEFVWPEATLSDDFPGTVEFPGDFEFAALTEAEHGSEMLAADGDLDSLLNDLADTGAAEYIDDAPLGFAFDDASLLEVELVASELPVEFPVVETRPESGGLQTALAPAELSAIREEGIVAEPDLALPVAIEAPVELVPFEIAATEQTTVLVEPQPEIAVAIEAAVEPPHLEATASDEYSVAVSPEMALPVSFEAAIEPAYLEIAASEEVTVIVKPEAENSAAIEAAVEPPHLEATASDEYSVAVSPEMALPVSFEAEIPAAIEAAVEPAPLRVAAAEEEVLVEPAEELLLGFEAPAESEHLGIVASGEESVTGEPEAELPVPIAAAIEPELFAIAAPEEEPFAVEPEVQVPAAVEAQAEPEHLEATASEPVPDIVDELPAAVEEQPEPDWVEAQWIALNAATPVFASLANLTTEESAIAPASVHDVYGEIKPAAVENLEALEAGPANSLAEDPDALDELVDKIDGEIGQSTGEDTAKTQAARREAQQVVFLLSGTRYAVPISEVLEMSTVPRVTNLPNVPEFVRGVTNLRGEVLAVIDLRVFLGVGGNGEAVRERMLVVRPKATETVAGLIVDGVRGLARIAEEDLRRPAGPLEDPVVSYLAGVTEHDNQVLHALDLQKLFRASEIAALSAH